MRIKAVLGIWLLVITLAWIAVVPAGPNATAVRCPGHGHGLVAVALNMPCTSRGCGASA